MSLCLCMCERECVTTPVVGFDCKIIDVKFCFFCNLLTTTIVENILPKLKSLHYFCV